MEGDPVDVRPTCIKRRDGLEDGRPVVLFAPERGHPGGVLRHDALRAERKQRGVRPQLDEDVDALGGERGEPLGETHRPPRVAHP